MTKLEAARTARGWTQTKLAWKARMTQSDISALEHGRISLWPAHAKRLAKVLGLDPAELMQDADAGRFG